MEFLEIHSVLDADSEYHVSFEFEGKIKSYREMTCPIFRQNCTIAIKNRYLKGRKEFPKMANIDLKRSLWRI